MELKDHVNMNRARKKTQVMEEKEKRHIPLNKQVYTSHICTLITQEKLAVFLFQKQCFIFFVSGIARL